MFSWLGINRSFAANPVTLGALALLLIAGAAAGRSNIHLTYTCAAVAPVATNVAGDGYYVGRYERIAYEACGRDRIPEDYVDRWPLDNCGRGHIPMYSDGTPALFPQVCRHNRGNVSVL